MENEKNTHRYMTILLLFHKKKPFHLTFLLPLTVFDHAFKKCVSTLNTSKGNLGETVWSRIIEQPYYTSFFINFKLGMCREVEV